MMTSQSPLTVTELIAAATSVLEAGGYSVREGFPDWGGKSTRLFEDEYNIVGVGVFATCNDLQQSWGRLQGTLVDTISARVGQNEGKAWDGYLVLLTPGFAPSEDADLDSIRQDTKRLRKLVATGLDLQSSGDVDRTLRPLLPLRFDQITANNASVLDRLPDLLDSQGIDCRSTEALVDAFREQKPLMESLRASLEEK